MNRLISVSDGRLKKELIISDEIKNPSCNDQTSVCLMEEKIES